VKPLHILFWLACATPLLALIPSNQDPATTDWPKEVERACTAKRYGLRLAASKAVAAGGGAAVPAIRAFAGQRGKNELPQALVDAIVDQDTTDGPVLDLLTEWAKDRDFYWRAQAMKGLARRAPRLPDRHATLAPLFAAHHDDPAWLTRVHARLGTALLGTTPGTVDPLTLPETDPRATSKLCALLLQNGKVPPLQPLFDALLDERTFQGFPWGQQRAGEAAKALRTWLGEDLPTQDGQSEPDKTAMITAMLANASRKSGQRLAPPTPLVDVAVPFTGVIEILSCRNGDLHLQWTAAGDLHAGIDATSAGRVPAPVWDELSRRRATLELGSSHGVVICDKMRLHWHEPAVNANVAPASLPAPAANWLERLAQALEQADQPRLAEALRAGLEQFAAR